jgi:hypothetical protein
MWPRLALNCDPPASAYEVLGLQAYTTTPCSELFLTFLLSLPPNAEWLSDGICPFYLQRYTFLPSPLAQPPLFPATSLVPGSHPCPQSASYQRPC